MTEQKRGREYYLQRLKKDSPSLYSAVLAGTMTVGAARKKAGLGGSRTRLHELKNAWTKGTPADRADFLSWISVSSRPTASSTPASIPPVASSVTAWHSDGTLLTWARRRIPEIMSRRRLKSGQVNDELGIKRLDQALSRAVIRGTRVRSTTTRTAVDRWLVANAKV